MIKAGVPLEQNFSTSLALFPQRRVARLSPAKRALLSAAIEERSTADFAYFVLWIAILIVAMSSWGFYKFGYKVFKLSDVLDSVFWYIWCLQNPDVGVGFVFGLVTVPAIYMPWCGTLLRWLYVEDFVSQFGAIVGFENILLRDTYFWPFVWSEFVGYAIGHVWWFTRDFLLTTIYFDKNEQRRVITWSQSRQEQRDYAGRSPPNAVELLRLVLLPPWHWQVLRRIENMDEPVTTENDNIDDNQAEQAQEEDIRGQEDDNHGNQAPAPRAGPPQHAPLQEVGPIE